MVVPVPDLFRLLAVPAFGWAALRDLRTRRIPNRIWLPLVALGALLVGWDLLRLGFGSPRGSLYVLRLVISVGLVGGLSILFWVIGGFGGADAKAFLTLAVLYPTYPTYEVGGITVPLVATDLGVFSLTVLTNAVLLGATSPLALVLLNLRSGTISPLAAVARRVPVENLPDRHGTLLDTDGEFTRSGLDLDALRMYLRWRRLDLATLRGRPELVDPATLPADPGDPTDGAVSDDDGDPFRGPDPAAVADPGATASAGSTDSTASDGATNSTTPVGATAAGDRWGAEAFLDDIEVSAYGTTPEELRAGLDRITAADRVWVSPGIPFLVPTFLGLLVGLTAGDLLFWLLSLSGLVGP
ncbi:MAG: prepilin peptidase [Halodesulfurarchaeum sp.]